MKSSDNRGSAVLALAFGAASILLFAFMCTVSSTNSALWRWLALHEHIFHLASIIFGCLAVIFYRSGKDSTKAHLAKGGLICGIVGMALTALIYLAVLFIKLFMSFPDLTTYLG